jgi:rRNA-processing protein FCF1
MKRKRKYILIALSIFCISTVFADNKLARINDPDGFTNIRSGQGKDFSIIATVDTTDFIYCDPTTKNDWVKIVSKKWKNGKQIEGYIHRTRIQFIEQLDNKKQKELLTEILRKQKSLAKHFQKTWKIKENKETRNKLELYSDIKYSPILEILPKYFCATSDTTIIELFFSTMWADKGSANEIPSFTIGECFICKPDLVIRELEKLTNKREKKFIIDDIEWGLLNYFEVGEDGKSNNPEFNKLKLKLEKQKPKS